MVKKNQIIQKASEKTDSLYKGVRKRKWGKFVSEIRLPNSRERIWLGSYDTAEKAARAFDAAQFCLRGSSAKFNFPNSPPEIAGGLSLTPSEIQSAAARFANSEPPASDSERTESSFSPSPSVSDGSIELDSVLDEFLHDIETGSGNYPPELGVFFELNDFCSDFFAPSPVSFDFVEENIDGGFNEDLLLWNF